MHVSQYPLTLLFVIELRNGATRDKIMSLF